MIKLRQLVAVVWETVPTWGLSLFTPVAEEPQVAHLDKLDKVLWMLKNKEKSNEFIIINFF